MKDIWDQKPGEPVAADRLGAKIWEIAFAAPVYIFNDNTVHWVFLWLTCKCFFNG